MLYWRRSSSMLRIEPSEEDIWKEIDAYDLSQSASVSDRLYWHSEMLVDRDIYDGLFTRSPRMPCFDSDLPVGHDPTDWIITYRLRCTDGISLNRIIEGLSYGDQDILQPAADLAEHTGVVKLLSYQLLHHEIEEPHHDPMFGSPVEALTGYVRWARYTLQMHQEVLKQAGVYEAIYISLFDYSRLSSSWLQSIIEHWDSATNTCWVGPNELTVTLWDLCTISGLPILGIPYEECIPIDYDLFSRRPAGQQRRGEFVHSAGLHKSLRHYYDLYQQRRRGRSRRGTISLEVWIESFLHPSALITEFGRIQDPFDRRPHDTEQHSEDLFEPGSVDGLHHISARRYSHDVLLISFVATWLCYFVFPSQNRVFRPSTLLMASLIATGRRVSLAPAVLAQIYRSLGKICTTYGSGQCSVEIPWHYLHGWMHIHVAGAFSCPELPGYFTERHFPSLLQLARATSSTDRAQIRLFMFAPLQMTDRYRLIYRSPLGSLPPQCFGVPLVDSQSEKRTPTLLSRSGYIPIASYFISMRPGWICYRRHGSVILEGYNPNRAARQFGLVQATPLDGLPVVPGIVDTRQLGSLPLSVCLEAASMTWAFLLRLGTGSRFYIPHMDAPTGISHLRLAWIRHTFSSFIEMGIRVYSRKARRQRPSEYPSVPQGHTTGHKETSKLDDRKRKRSPEPTFRHGGPVVKDRPISPPTDRGHPRHRSSNNVPVSKHISADLPSSPILVPDTLPTPPGFPFSAFSIDQSKRLSSSQSTHSNSTQMLFEDAADDTITELAISSSLFSDSTWVIVDDVPESSSLSVTAHLGDYYSSGSSDEIHLSGSELACFVSRIPSRARRYFGQRLLSRAHHIVTALRHLLLGVDLDDLPFPDLASFCVKASLLLDCAAASGLQDTALETWEYLCRVVAFGLYQLHFVPEELAIGVPDGLEDAVRAAWERMKRISMDRDFGLQALRRCQRDISAEQLELLEILGELRALRQRGMALLERRQDLRAAATYTEEEFTWIAAEIERLEQDLTSSTEEFDSLRHQLETTQTRQMILQDRMFRIRQQIGSLQFSLR
ncbi:hypothetical protein KFK09_020881 [Dendrobium nobile]|uniref:Aminotransferase-like plant mobile domain-containing protein n=1 Tax=Dendrobium nobile TaxID=94219 RepID=A0A8T3ANM3_DENNO|nr:hypothetical protein KFK09_020881 [Dendrobium nobile]